MTPDQALELLAEGNRRFRTGKGAERDLLAQVRDTTGGQWPYAVILSCVDSRTSVELIFDAGIGDLFSARLAGNVLNEDVLGSMEFACKVAGSCLVVVLGHTACGAVKGALRRRRAGQPDGAPGQDPARRGSRHRTVRGRRAHLRERRLRAGGGRERTSS